MEGKFFAIFWRIFDFFGPKKFFHQKIDFFGPKVRKNREFKNGIRSEKELKGADIGKFSIFDPPQSRVFGLFLHPHRVIPVIWTRWARKSALEALKPPSLAGNDFWPPKNHVPGLYLPWKSLSEFIGFLKTNPEIFSSKGPKLSEFKIFLERRAI